MYSRINRFELQTDYYSQYQSMYDQVIVFDQETDYSGVEQGDGEEETIYSDFHDTSIQQPSHPYNGDIMPVA